MRHIIIYIAAAMLVSCNVNPKQEAKQAETAVEAEAEDPFVKDSLEYEEMMRSLGDWISDRQKAASQGSSASTDAKTQGTNRSTMSASEDAWEEARSLAEEDRRNGSRSHEGDDYDDDYDEDFDDGYDD